jgi:Tol biopolymer transport system component
MPSSTRGLLGAFSLALLCACNADKTLTTPTAAPPTDSLAAKFPPLLGQIAFTSNRDGSPYIYVAAADGSSLRRLAAGFNPAWSRDGQQLAFNGNGIEDTTSDQPIYVINADGSGERLLPIRGVGPVWSPDGRQLAYSNGRGIYVANSDGSNPRQLLSNDFPSPGDTVSGPVWSPDGKRIAFISASDVECQDGCYDAQFQLYVVNTDGSGIQPLGPHDPNQGFVAFQAFSASWSPDGSRVAFETAGPVGAAIGIANADGSGAQTVTTSIQQPTTPDWSPDGRVLSFTGLLRFGTRIFANDPSLNVTIQLVPDAELPVHLPYGDFQAVWSRVVKP